MRRTLSVLVATLAATAPLGAQSFTSRTAFTTLLGTPSYIETFETVPIAKDGPHCGPFSQHGITYTPLAGTGCNQVWVQTPAGAGVGSPFYGAGIGTLTSSVLTADGNEWFQLTFAQPTYAVGFDVYLNGLGPATARFWSGSTLLATIGLGGGSLTAPQRGSIGFEGYAGTSALTLVEFQATNGGVLNTAIDNVTVYDAPVTTAPEPASVVLIASGLVGVGLIARRRRR
jgi:hypothetical protein